jgi:hypothetical protein
MAYNYEKYPAEEWHPAQQSEATDGRYYEDAANGVWLCEKRVAGEIVSTEQAEDVEEAFRLFLVVLRS